jgi:hypothetical protein
MTTLSSYLKSKLEAWVPFDGFDGFEVKLAYLSREELGKIRSAVTRTTFNPKTRQKEETTDSELFVKEFVKSAVLDWKGFTFDIATKILPMDVPADIDPSTEIEYSEENALDLSKNSPAFDGWLNDVIFDLEIFRNRRD